ncbi:MAG: outer membrane protein assembly factor BamA, partial [Gluconacetobacter diazotrophicus]|nr:outer membrane protein assembly factor BamA [Gluconacetobacter diazotrophicus]
MSGKRFALLASACLLPVPAESAAFAQTGTVARTAGGIPAGHARHRAAPRHVVPAAAQPTGGRIRSIRIEGNSRIESGTILSYMVVQAGDPFNQEELDRSLKTLYATGLFRDVTLHRNGDELVVVVVENPIVNRISFEGNHAVKDDDLRKEISLRPRAVYTAEMASRDRQKILDLYAQKGRYAVTVTPQIIRLSHNRVDVIFQITEGELTLIRRIAFVGNHAFSENRLSQVITSKEHAWYRFFSSSDEYNPDRVKYDAELLRRFYLRNGYVDFNVTDATAELTPDRKAFLVTFTLDEGPRYRINHIQVKSSLRHVTSESLRPRIDLFEHQWYNGDDVQKVSEGLQNQLQATGEPFASVKPEIARNVDNHTVDLLFDVSEGPHVYVDRIDINGNTITRDNVVRR